MTTMTRTDEERAWKTPPGEEEEIFRKFHRVRGERESSGVGLGLAICRGIVEAHRGSIRVSARSGGGAVFTVVLPARDDTPAGTLGDGEEAR